MDVADQLWTLQQIFRTENTYHDPKSGLHLYRIPTDLSADRLKALERGGRMPGKMSFPQHDDIWDAFYALADTWTLSEAAGAFLAGMWSAPFLWQSALCAKLLAQAAPRHPFTPYAGSKDTCMICGFRKKAVDPSLLWYQRMTGGVPLDGEPTGYVSALREMAKYEQRPTPTSYDLWTFRAILTVIRQMPSRSRYSRVRDALYREKLLPAAQKWVYGSLLEASALAGILDTPDHPGMATRYTSYKERDLRPSVRVEVQAPLAWWDSSIGINEDTLHKIFGDIDLSSVSLTDRPGPIPPLSQTVTGRMKMIRSPRKRLPAAPDAGKGPIRPGDVYAIRIRDGTWITAYCHRTEGTYAIMEYLSGIFSEMPMRSQIICTFQLRGSKRWQARTSGMDRTTGVKRIARDIPTPCSDLPVPDKIPFARAADLGWSAGWCFRDLL